jgi:hypothetical protein
MEQSFDVFIAFHAATTVSSKELSDEAMLVQAQFIELTWSAYSVERKEVDEDARYFIQFEGPLTEDIIGRTKITQDKMKQAVSLKEALDNLSMMITNKYIRNSKKVCLVTFGDDLLSSLLPKESNLKGISLQSEYLKYFDICEEFRTVFTQFSQKFESPNDVLRIVNLKIVEDDTVCLTECKSLIRIMNILVRNKHKFSKLKIVEIQPVYQNNSSSNINMIVSF